MKHRLLLTLFFLMVAMMVAGQEIAPKYPPANQQKYNQYIDAARKGDMKAQMEIARCLDSRDVDCCIYWVGKAAEQEHETAFAYQSQQHGMFTYYLLKKLQESKGRLTLGEPSDYLTKEVKRESFEKNNKKQTPSVNASPALAASWRTMKLK